MGGFPGPANANSRPRLAIPARHAILRRMPTSRRSPLPAGLAAVLSCAALVAACGRDQPSEETSTLNNIVQQLPSVPIAEAPLDRAALLFATMRAVSALAAGADDSTEQRRLAGKRFELRLRFGCGGGVAGDEGRGWRFDTKQRTIKLKVAPDISGDDPVAAAIAGDAFETIEGFWLRRPWLLTPACPVAPVMKLPDAEDAAAAKPEPDPGIEDESEPAAAPLGRRVGIAQFFTESDSRTARRRNRAYESTTVLAADEPPSPSGYDFVLSGRLRALPDRRVVACVTDAPQVAPSCIISVHVDRVWIERADNHKQLAEWTGG